MRRKKRLEDRENHDRWLISYADFITLLFAFFVVMYATSTVNEGKYRVFGDALTSAFLNKPQDPKPQEKPTPIKKPQSAAGAEIEEARREKMRAIASDIMSAMSPLVKVGQVRVMQSRRGVTIEINASLLFSSGQAVLEPGSVKTLNAVAQVLRGDDHDIQVEGYTDDTPISTPSYPSNWELSSARAASVVRLFAENGVNPGRMVAEGYGEYRPIEPNATPEGRARNRRVTIMILAAAPDSETDIPIK